MKKAVFIVQGEGRGHLSQAMALMEYCQEAGVEVERIYTGGGKSRPVPGYFEKACGERLRYFQSPYFLKKPGRRGYDIPRTLLFQMLRIPFYLAEVRRLRKELSALNPDLVVNFYDGIGALAMRKLFPHTRRIGVGHHFLLHLEDYPGGSGSPLQKKLLSWHTRIVLSSCDEVLALSFRDRPGEGKVKVVPPLVRKDFREARHQGGDAALVYLLNEGFISDLIRTARERSEFRADVFSGLPTETRVPPGITLHTFHGESFLDKMRTCERVVTTAGFDTIAEAACMGVPLVAVPSENHFEQQCNAADLELSGLGIRRNRMDPEALCSPLSPPDPSFKTWLAQAGEIFIKFMAGY